MTSTDTTTEATEWTAFSRELRITRKVHAKDLAEARRVFKAQFGRFPTSVMVER